MKINVRFLVLQKGGGWVKLISLMLSQVPRIGETIAFKNGFDYKVEEVFWDLTEQEPEAVVTMKVMK